MSVEFSIVYVFSIVYDEIGGAKEIPLIATSMAITLNHVDIAFDVHTFVVNLHSVSNAPNPCLGLKIKTVAGMFETQAGTMKQ